MAKKGINKVEKRRIEVKDSRYQVTTKEVFTNKLLMLWYVILPYILNAAATFYCVRKIFIRRHESEEGVKQISFNKSFFLLDGAGDPNLFAFIAVLSFFACLILVPNLMLKIRKKGDGLGLMFLPCGFLGIYIIMTAIESLLDIPLGVIVGLLLFWFSAMATFRKAMPYTEACGLALMLVLTFTFLASKIPYCYYRMDELNVYMYSLSYYIRDMLLLIAFTLFCGRLKTVYKYIDDSKIIKE